MVWSGPGLLDAIELTQGFPGGKKEKDRKEKVIGSWPGTCTQYTRLQ